MSKPAFLGASVQDSGTSAVADSLSPQEVQRRFEALAWLADSPLFVDKEQVAAFYDAVIQPEGQLRKVVLSLEKYKDHEVELRGSVTGKLSLAGWIKTIFPFLDAEVGASAEAAGKVGGGSKEGESVEIYAIETPQRRLVQLAFHYLSNIPERFLVVGNEQLTAETVWYDKELIKKAPRALVFIDFPAGTKFIPMAAEVQNGSVITVFNRLETEREKPPPPPKQSAHEPREEWLVRKDLAWSEYWDWFERTFDSRVALEIVEEFVSRQGKIEWIDFRVPVRSPQRPIHLHVCGRGQFSTGTFAYNLIKRGFNHGLRVVGTLKSEPDLNVLAIFEK